MHTIFNFKCCVHLYSLFEWCPLPVFTGHSNHLKSRPRVLYQTVYYQLCGLDYDQGQTVLKKNFFILLDPDQFCEFLRHDKILGYVMEFRDRQLTTEMLLTDGWFYVLMSYQNFTLVLVLLWQTVLFFAIGRLVKEHTIQNVLIFLHLLSTVQQNDFCLR